ncbi:hypothetical protein LZ30DRAFT_122007 [Colletotrichum cereale]|nr:hypothetical protein LZ30DRAFT_122007 [Colletotrichum cereale]
MATRRVNAAGGGGDDCERRREEETSVGDGRRMDNSSVTVSDVCLSTTCATRSQRQEHFTTAGPSKCAPSMPCRSRPSQVVFTASDECVRDRVEREGRCVVGMMQALMVMFMGLLGRRNKRGHVKHEQVGGRADGGMGRGKKRPDGRCRQV